MNYYRSGCHTKVDVWLGTLKLETTEFRMSKFDKFGAKLRTTIDYSSSGFSNTLFVGDLHVWLILGDNDANFLQIGSED